MAYHFENIKLEKGMYGRSSRSFSQALEELDPSASYENTEFAGLDAYQRQLKRVYGAQAARRFPPVPQLRSRGAAKTEDETEFLI